MTHRSTRRYYGCFGGDTLNFDVIFGTILLCLGKRIVWKPVKHIHVYHQPVLQNPPLLYS